MMGYKMELYIFWSGCLKEQWPNNLHAIIMIYFDPMQLHLEILSTINSYYFFRVDFFGFQENIFGSGDCIIGSCVWCMIKLLQYCPDPETMTELNGRSGKYCLFHKCAFGDLSLLNLKGKKRHSIHMYIYSGQHLGLIMWLSINK